jgi:hypothetical protein
MILMLKLMLMQGCRDVSVFQKWVGIADGNCDGLPPHKVRANQLIQSW